MFELTDQERKAMNWALATPYASVAADYAKVLAKALTRAMAPSQDEAVLPEIASPDPCGSPVICKCGWIVGIMDEFGESILDSEDHTRANFCGQCGAEMDYSEFDLSGFAETDDEDEGPMPEDFVDVADSMATLLLVDICNDAQQGRED